MAVLQNILVVTIHCFQQHLLFLSFSRMAEENCMLKELWAKQHRLQLA